MRALISFRIAVLAVLGWLSCWGTTLLGQEARQDSQRSASGAEWEGKADAAQFRVYLEENPHVDVLATETVIGVSLVPVDATLRSHLPLPEGQGLVVAGVALDSAAAKAGIEPRDILITAGEQPLAAASDLDKAVRASGDQPIRIHLIRAGKPRELDVAATKRISFVVRDGFPPPYWIGVQASPADETLRAQLQLPDGQGLVATSVLPEGPAIKAGLKPNDVLVTLGGKPLTSVEDLVARVQETKDHPVTLEIIRAGKPMKVEIVPQKREQALKAVRELNSEPKTDYLLRFVHPQVLVTPRQDASVSFPELQKGAVVARLEPANENGKGIEQKLRELIAEVKKLQKEVSKLEDSLEHQRRSEAESKRP